MLSLSRDQLKMLRFEGALEYVKRNPTWKITTHSPLKEPDVLVTTAMVTHDGKDLALGFRHPKADIGGEQYKKMLAALNESMAQLLAIPPSEKDAGGWPRKRRKVAKKSK